LNSLSFQQIVAPAGEWVTGAQRASLNPEKTDEK
jgi:hypothetical protein